MKMITPDEIASQFLSQYKKWESGEQYTEMFTDEQNVGMFNTIIADPSGMLEFYNEVQTLLVGQIAIERGEDNHIEIAKVMVQWNNALNAFLLPIMSLLGKPADQRKEMIEAYQKQQAINDAARDNVTSLDEFKLPDLVGSINDDEDPQIH